MQKINFNNGHHLDKETFDFIQDAYIKPIEALMNGSEQNFVISGVEETYNGNTATVSDGFVVLNGEAMEFVGGSYDTLSENRWVVRRVTKSSNINSEGKSVEAFTKVWAEMSATYKDGAIDVALLSKKRLCHFVSGYKKSGIITLSNIASALDSVDLAHQQGYASVADATPKYQIQDGRLSITGFFKTSGSFSGTRNLLGVIPNWNGPEVNGIKCELHVPTTEEGQTEWYRILVDVRANGYIVVQDGAYNAGACYGVAFDGTPYMVMTK